MLKKKSLFLVVMTLVCALMFTACGKKEDTKAVSYTHLTLPTID